MKTKLVFLLPSLAGGGAERVASILIPYFHRAFELTVILIENNKAYFIPEEVRVEVLSGRIASTSHLVRAPLHLLKLNGILRQIRPHVVLSFMEEANILNCMTVKASKHRVILSQRVDPLLQYSSKGVLGRIISSISRRLYPQADHIISVSKGIKRTLIAEYNVDERRITAIGNPIDFRKVQELAKMDIDSLPQGVFLVSIGRLSIPQKGQEILLQAFSKALGQYPDTTLAIIGDGPDRNKLEILAEELGIEDNVLFAGWQENVPTWLARASGCIIASRWEGWPNVITEALATGCPVVATDCPTGPREILDNGKYGTLVSVDDSEAMAGAIVSLLLSQPSEEDKSLLTDRAEEFDAPNVSKRYISAISGAI